MLRLRNESEMRIDKGIKPDGPGSIRFVEWIVQLHDIHEHREVNGSFIHSQLSTHLGRNEAALLRGRGLAQTGFAVVSTPDGPFILCMRFSKIHKNTADTLRVPPTSELLDLRQLLPKRGSGVRASKHHQGFPGVRSMCEQRGEVAAQGLQRHVRSKVSFREIPLPVAVKLDIHRYR